MNQGGEPGHDDYGLPRVDIEIPDDARELDRDVQAYHRELRAIRRRQRSRRWRAPIQRPGVLMPLVAGCLLIAMLSGMVLTMFSANSYISELAGQQNRGSGAPAGHGSPATGGGVAPPAMSASGSAPGPSLGGGSPTSAPPGRVTRVLLPNRTITVAGKPVALRSLTTAALAIVPATCGCFIALRELLMQASKAAVPVYLVGSPRGAAAVVRLASSPGLRTALVATDRGNVLATTFHVASLTVLLVDYRGAVTVASGLLPGLRLGTRLASLARPRS